MSAKVLFVYELSLQQDLAEVNEFTVLFEEGFLEVGGRKMATLAEDFPQPFLLHRSAFTERPSATDTHSGRGNTGFLITR
jgi:hypothetical protein